MKRKVLALLLAAVIAACCGCQSSDTNAQETTEPEITEPVGPTVPADGNPDDVTCRGSYTAEAASSTIIARSGGKILTNDRLQSWYWGTVAQYRQAGHGENPDYDQPLDTQICEIDSTVASWQQYFLKLALDTWHTSAALEQLAAETELVTEEAYQPNAQTHERAMTGKPASRFLYGHNKFYQTNTMHQEYLDSIPQLLKQLAEEEGYASAEALASGAFASRETYLEDALRQYNYAYMYQTFLNYDTVITEQMLEDRYGTALSEDGTEKLVDFRHIQLFPFGDWDVCETQAQELLKQWRGQRNHSEATFGEMAYRNSQDLGSASSGGRYARVSQDQLPEELAQWFFDEERQPGDTDVIRTEQAVHVVYFSGATTRRRIQAEEELKQEIRTQQILQAKEAFPLEITYDDIRLANAEGTVSFEQLLYPDVAHERYPEVPLYLQQEYPRTWYGAHKISSHGCGITTFSMLATYMSDEEWTPPEMCERHGNYSFDTGTDGMIFVKEPPKYNFYIREITYDPNRAKEALEAGHIVVSSQHAGYWTRAGHYILFEKLTEDGMVQVRDSNIANYVKLPQHAEDKHTWFNATYSGYGYWVFEKKITRVEGCNRCGTPQDLMSSLLQGEYLCERCTQALDRRNAWLDMTA